MKKLFFPLLTTLSILAINTEKSYGAKNSSWSKNEEEKIRIPSTKINEIYFILPYFLTCVEKLQAALPTNIEMINDHTAQVAVKITVTCHYMCVNLISDLEKITNSTCPRSYENTGKDPAMFVWARLLGNFLQNKPYEVFKKWLKKFPTEKRGPVLLKLLIHDCYLEKNDDSLHGFSPLCSFYNNLKSLQLFALELNAIINEQSSVENKIFETHAKKIGELLDYFKAQKSSPSQYPSYEE